MFSVLKQTNGSNGKPIRKRIDCEFMNMVVLWEHKTINQIYSQIFVENGYR